MTGIWPRLYAATFLLFAGHVLLQAFSSALWSGFLACALLAMILLTIAGCGRMLLRGFSVKGLTEPEKSLVGATLGLGLLSQALFFLGAAGLLKTGAVSALLAVFWVIGFTELRALGASLSAYRELARGHALLSGGVVFFLALLLWLCFVPPHQYDSLVYHLPLAADYAREGRLSIRPDLLFSHFPQNGEMLFTLALLLGSDQLAQMFPWLGLFLSVFWVLETGKRLVPASTALFACVLLVSQTGVMLLASTAYVECLVMLWVTAAVFSFLRWRAEADEPGMPRGWLALSALFAGIGVGTKYYAGIVPMVLGTALLGRWLLSFRAAFSRDERLSRFRDGAVFAVLAALSGAPWLVKNWVVVGNPVFPFFYDLLPSRGIAWGPETAQRYFSVLVEYGHEKGAFLKDLAQLPYLAAVGSTRFGAGADVLGSLGWALCFAAAPAAIWAAAKKRVLRWALLYCAAHWIVWFSTGVVLRFLVAILPIWSLLAAHGLHAVSERLRGGFRLALWAGAGVFLFSNAALFLFVNFEVGSFGFLTGVRSRAQFLSEKFDYYPCAVFARERLPHNDRILVVGEQRGFYLRQPQTITTPMAPNEFVVLANEAETAAAYGGALRSRGYRHLLLVPREGARLAAQYDALPFSPRGREIWTAFSKNGLELLHESRGRCAVYSIR